MNITPTVVTFIKSLQKVAGSIKWIGHIRGEKTWTFNGSYKKFRAFFNGFEISICKHEYNEGETISSRVYMRRNINIPTKGPFLFYEIDVHDHLARFGRKCIMERVCFSESDKGFKEISKLFEVVDQVGEIFDSVNEKMSSKKAITNLTQLLKQKKAPA